MSGQAGNPAFEPDATGVKGRATPEKGENGQVPLNNLNSFNESGVQRQVGASKGRAGAIRSSHGLEKGCAGAGSTFCANQPTTMGEARAPSHPPPPD